MLRLPCPGKKRGTDPTHLPLSQAAEEAEQEERRVREAASRAAKAADAARKLEEERQRELERIRLAASTGVPPPSLPPVRILPVRVTSLTDEHFETRQRTASTEMLLTELLENAVDRLLREAERAARWINAEVRGKNIYF